MSYNVSQRLMVSHSLSWCLTVSYNVSQRLMVSHGVSRCHIMSHRGSWCLIVSHGVSQCHIMSHRGSWCLVVYLMMSYDVLWCLICCFMVCLMMCYDVLLWLDNCDRNTNWELIRLLVVVRTFTRLALISMQYLQQVSLITGHK